MNTNNISKGFTGFIDILGFSNMVQNSKTIKDISNIYFHIKTIHKIFNFNTQELLIKESQEVFKQSVLAFSDCIIFNLQFDSDGMDALGEFDGIMQEIISTATSQAKCIQKGFFIRGGLDFGWWYHEDEILISNSLVGAYNAESKATVPVLAITTKLYDFLNSHPGRNHYKAYDPMQLFIKYNDDTKQQSFWYIDYIQITIDNLDWRSSPEIAKKYFETDLDHRSDIIDEGYTINVHGWLSSHARAIENGYQNSPNQRAKEKYLWLMHYHNLTVLKNDIDIDSCFCRIV